jgi:hypothetical protein
MSIKIHEIPAGLTLAGAYAATLLIAFAAQAQSHTTTTTAPPATAQTTQIGPDALFAHWDKDKNKALSLDEFKAGLQEMQNAAALRALHDNFVAHDTNKNNVLDATEYANLELIRKAGTTAPPLSAFDTDKNQSLDFKEYVGMVTKLVNDKH